MAVPLNLLGKGRKTAPAAAVGATDLAELEREIAELTKRQAELRSEVTAAQRELGNLAPAADADLGELQANVAALQGKATAGAALLKSIDARLAQLQADLAAAKELAAAVERKRERVELDNECEALATEMAAIAERARSLSTRLVAHDQFAAAELRGAGERIAGMIAAISPAAKQERIDDWHAGRRAYQATVEKQRAARQGLAARERELKEWTEKQAGSGAWA